MANSGNFVQPQGKIVTNEVFLWLWKSLENSVNFFSTLWLPCQISSDTDLLALDAFLLA